MSSTPKVPELFPYSLSHLLLGTRAVPYHIVILTTRIHFYMTKNV